jgi:hypothetical protein
MTPSEASAFPVMSDGVRSIIKAYQTTSTKQIIKSGGQMHGQNTVQRGARGRGGRGRGASTSSAQVAHRPNTRGFAQRQAQGQAQQAHEEGR